MTDSASPLEIVQLLGVLVVLGLLWPMRLLWAFPALVGLLCWMAGR